MNTLRFLQTLYRKDAPGYLPLWTSGLRRTRWVPANDLSRAAETAVELGQRGDVYFGVGLHPEELGPYERGRAEGVIAIPGLWTDVDIEGEAHKGKNLPLTVEDAMKAIEAFPLAPTLVLHSGHGLQPWWLFEGLWVFEGEEERKKAQDLSRRFQATLKAAAQERGWGMDGTHDISRVMRVPGTLNHKLEPAEVKVLHHNEDARYDPEDFKPHLLTGFSEEGHVVSFSGDDHDAEGARALLKLLEGRLSGRILRAIEEGPEAFEAEEGKDGSSSGADAAVCTALIGAGLTDTQIRDIYKAYPIGTS